MNGFIKAKLVSLHHVDVLLFTTAQLENNPSFTLFIDGIRAYSPTIVRRTSNKDVYLFRLELKEAYDFAKRYFLGFLNFPLQTIDVSNVPDFKEFNELFTYDGDDLGNTYSEKETSFAVWAPISPSVQLLIEGDNGFISYDMTRTDKGVYRITLPGDYKNKKYRYLIENNGVSRETTDIYAKASSINSEYSVVIDLKEVDKLGTVNFKNADIKMVDSIIYEVHVRDFTEDKNTDIEQKGKYLGFVEENRKTKGGHPAGLDYLTYLGITHVQLQPIHDVNNVPEDNPKFRYNWGYDPCSYFVLEGAYSSNPFDPYSRIKEFKTMVNKLHKRNIGVIIDVVYNHCYEWLYTAFEKTVPNYYFRKKKDGSLSSISGCGNDMASERPMVRKLIVDSVTYLFKQFDIDGLRFDLMGLLDINTMLEVEKAVRAIKPNAFLYGEGWNMGLQIPESERASADNADKLENFAFFNDMYRDIVKGPTFKDGITTKGFANGDHNYYFGLEFAMNGSVLDLSYRHKFNDANQSINYVECHDNNTLFDKLVKSNPEEDESIIYDRVRLANDIVMLSFGVPFFHMGQEIGQSKLGLDNTYNILKINNMNWLQVDKNFDMVDHFKFTIDIRKNHLLYLHKSKPEEIANVYKFEKLDNNVVKIKVATEDYKNMEIYINTTNDPQVFVFDDYHSVLVNTAKDNPILKTFQLAPARLNVIYKSKK